MGEDFEPVEPKNQNTPRCNLPDDDMTGAAACHYRPGSEHNKLKEVKRIALFHYITKSWHDFEKKMVRGDGNSAAPETKKSAAYFFRMQQYALISLVSRDMRHALFQPHCVAP